MTISVIFITFSSMTCIDKLLQGGDTRTPRSVGSSTLYLPLFWCGLLHFGPVGGGFVKFRLFSYFRVVGFRVPEE